MIKFSRLFVMIVISFFIAFNFTETKKDKLENEVEQYFRYLTDTIYRYQINVFNSKIVTDEYNKPKGLLYFNTPTIDEKTKNISVNIDNFFRLINENKIIQGNVWKVANIYPNYMYIKPYSDKCKNRSGDKIVNCKQYFDYLLKKEKIKRNLEQSNLTVYETMKVYGPYYKDKIKGEIITVYYPLYFDRKIDSILLLDIKADFLKYFLHDFNGENFTNFSLDKKIKLNEFIFNIIAKQKYFDPMKIPIQRSYWFFSLICLVIFIFLFVTYEFILFLRENINDNKKDKLTGLYRKDCFNDTKYSVSCIIIIDIDYFKNINDTYGHQVGDIVLKEVSDRIRYFISKTDIGIRWGGEEFVILLGEEIDIKQLKIKLNQLLHAISDIKICNIDVTISIGSFLSPNKIILANAFKSADEALYESKRTGRNKYTILMN